MKKLRQELVLITGMSGSGKSGALHALEDAGYSRASESIDLMLALIGKLIDADFAYVGSDSSVYFSAQKFASLNQRELFPHLHQ